MIGDVSSVGAGSAGAAGGSSTASTAALGKDDFLKLLVAQMSHQDPLNPMDGAQFAAQLAQFTSVEQLTSLNAKMDAQATSQAAIVQALNGSTALSAVGKTVTAVGDQVAVTPGVSSSIGVQVDDSGGVATLKLLDDSGAVVGSRSLGKLDGGFHSVEVGDAAKGLPAGTYTFEVDVVDDAGASVQTQPVITARVDGIRYGANGPMLAAGGINIPFGSILEIADK